MPGSRRRHWRSIQPTESPERTETEGGVDPIFWFNLVQNIVLIATLLLVFRQLRHVERATHRDALARAVEDHDRLNEILLQYPKLNAYLRPAGGYAGWSSDEVDFMT